MSVSSPSRCAKGSVNPTMGPLAYETDSIIYPENRVPTVGAEVIELRFSRADVDVPVAIEIDLLKSMSA